jgi:hypothetical protein
MWYYLKEDEIIREGDWYDSLITGEWVPCIRSVGQHVTRLSVGKYRRPIEMRPKSGFGKFITKSA